MGDPTSPGNPATRPKRGRPFAKGNPGRPRGSKNRSTLIAEALPEHWEVEVLRAAYEKACDGDPQLLKFFLSRMLPRERVMPIELPPIEDAESAVQAMNRIRQFLADGEITAGEAADLVRFVNEASRPIELADVVKRIDELEAIIRGRNT